MTSNGREEWKRVDQQHAANAGGHAGTHRVKDHLRIEEQRIDENADYWIYYYRPKLEESFTRFEKWVKKTDGQIHWRSRSKTNVISIYGLESTGSTRIFNHKL